MSQPFRDRVFLITGASSGIGEALARAIAAQGGVPLLCARREDRIQKVCEEIRAQGGRAHAYRCDVNRDGDVARVVQEASRVVPRIDGVIANAGFGVSGEFERLTLDDYRRQFETNVFGVIRTLKETRDAVIASRGQWVIMGSVAGHVAISRMSAYGASKFAVRAIAEALYYEMRPHGVGVTLISPGFVASEIRKVDNQGQLQTVDDPIPNWILVPTAKAARQILRAIARRKPEAVITGHGKAIVWIKRHFPALIRFIASRGIRGRPEPKTLGQSSR